MNKFRKGQKVQVRKLKITPEHLHNQQGKIVDKRKAETSAFEYLIELETSGAFVAFFHNELKVVKP